MIIEVFSAHGGGRYWRRLLNEWQRAGHTVREVCAFDDAKYRRTRGRTGKLWLRLTTYVFFPLKAWFRLRCMQDSDDTVRVVITAPFYLPWVAAWSRGARSGAPIVNLVNDLFPDALIHAGLLKPGAWSTGNLKSMTKYCLKRCDATVFLGNHLMAYAEQNYGRARMSRVIPVGADSTFVRDTPPNILPRAEPIRILYSGTMGHMHDTETFLELSKRGVPEGIHFTFHSSGVGYDRLARALAPLRDDETNRISLLGPLSDAAWRETLNMYPIGLVTLKPGAQNVSMPSKAYSALAAGQALLAVCPFDSDLAELIRKHDCGWVVQPGQINELRSLLAHIVADREEVHTKRLKAFRAGHFLYDMAAISEQYLHLFNDLLEDSRRNAASRGIGQP